MTARPPPLGFESLDYAALERCSEDQERLSLSGQLYWWLGVLLVAAALVGGQYGRLHTLATVMGVVVPASHVHQVQHLEGGIITAILVKEGQQVSRDTPLVELDTVSSGADLAEIEARIDAFEIELIRWRAEQQERLEPNFPDALRERQPQLVNHAQRLLNSRLSEHKNMMRAKEAQVLQRREQMKEVSHTIRNLKARKRLLDEQVKINNQLISNQLSNRYQQIEVLKEVNGVVTRLAEQQGLRAQTRAALSGVEAERAATADAYAREISEALAKNEQSLTEFKERRRKLADNLLRTVIRSSVDGVIKSIATINVGAVIRPGQVVMDIVPGEDKLLVEAKLSPQDIGYVRTGQTAFVRLAAANAFRLGSIDAKVMLISPDTLINEQGEVYYKVMLALDREYFGEGEERYPLVPGVQVLGGIVTGSRTILDYVFSPLLQGGSFALSER